MSIKLLYIRPEGVFCPRLTCFLRCRSLVATDEHVGRFLALISLPLIVSACETCFSLETTLE